jgi:hypothetical protein
MKPLNDKLKHILIDITVVFVVPIGLFFLYTTLATPGGALYGTEQPGSELAGEGQKFLIKLNELNSLKLDTSVFQSAVYQSLVDTTVPPPTEDKGRPYPFVPPTRYTAPAQNTVPSKTKTSNAVKNLDALLKK